MWYFAWILGLPLAAAFAVLNAMWFEMTEDQKLRDQLMNGPNSDAPRQTARTPHTGPNMGLLCFWGRIAQSFLDNSKPKIDKNSRQGLYIAR